MKGKHGEAQRLDPRSLDDVTSLSGEHTVQSSCKHSPYADPLQITVTLYTSAEQVHSVGNASKLDLEGGWFESRREH